jgi:hypothetical protein
MAELLKCIECGKPVSSAALSCPHCGTSKFRGICCDICGKIDKITLMNQGFYQKQIYGYYYTKYTHITCQELIKETSTVVLPSYCYSCPVCKTSYALDKTRKSLEFNCKNCGHLIKASNPYFDDLFTNCLACGQIVVRQKAVTINHLDKIYCFHPVCGYNKSLKNLIFGNIEKEIEYSKQSKIEYEKWQLEKKRLEDSKRNIESGLYFFMAISVVCTFILVLSFFVQDKDLSKSMFVRSVIGHIVNAILCFFYRLVTGIE